MRIGFLLRAPTQIDAPFFRYLSSRRREDIKVIYTRSDQLTDRVFDAELAREISWGIDLLAGYPYAVLPTRKRVSWLVHELRRQRYDLLVINGYSDPALLTGAVAAKLASVPVALRLDTPSFRVERSAKLRLRRVLYAMFRRVYDHFLPVGRSAAEFLARVGVKPEQMSLFPYTVDLEYFRARSSISAETKRELRRRHGLPEGERVVLAVTKFNHREAPWDLLRAHCAMDSPPARLWLVGDGPARPALESYVQRHACRGVVFGGYLPYPDLPAAYGVADAFVHPPRYEPWGVSVPEALACGLPVLVSSMVGAGRDLVTPGKNGFIYRAGDPSDLRRKLPQLLDLISSPELQPATTRNLAQCHYPALWETISGVARRCAHPASGSTDVPR